MSNPTTGEWTLGEVEKLYWKGGLLRIVDAHNAALASDFGRDPKGTLEHSERGKRQVIDQDRTVSAVSSLGGATSAQDALDKAHSEGVAIGLASANAHNAALDEAVDAAEQEILLLREQLAAEKKQVAFWKREHEAAHKRHIAVESELAAERKRTEHWRNLRQVVPDTTKELQLREQVQALVDAIQEMPRRAYEVIIEKQGDETVNSLPNELQCIADDALAKVKEKQP